MCKSNWISVQTIWFLYKYPLANQEIRQYHLRTHACLYITLLILKQFITLAARSAGLNANFDKTLCYKCLHFLACWTIGCIQVIHFSKINSYASLICFNLAQLRCVFDWTGQIIKKLLPVHVLKWKLWHSI